LSNKIGHISIFYIHEQFTSEMLNARRDLFFLQKSGICRDMVVCQDSVALNDTSGAAHTLLPHHLPRTKVAVLVVNSVNFYD